MYDSRPETYKHSLRVNELIGEMIKELMNRGATHDKSKTEEPELAVFDEYTPKLKDAEYGSEEYKEFLVGMGAGLIHHYEVNRHHPEHFADGIDGMTLIDIMEMFADWKAATERNKGGSLSKSLAIQEERFEISEQLAQILANTAAELGWL